MVKIDEKAPEFIEAWAYQAGEFKKISLVDYRGRWVVLFFYPEDFTFVCPTEIEEFSRLEKEFEQGNAVVIGCSTDSRWSHKNWFETDPRLEKVKYPILADTTHEISRSYGVLQQDGTAARGTFVIDPEGFIRSITVSSNSVGRSVKETLRVLKALQTGDLCPVEWEPGEKTLGAA